MVALAYIIFGIIFSIPIFVIYKKRNRDPFKEVLKNQKIVLACILIGAVVHVVTKGQYFRPNFAEVFPRAFYINFFSFLSSILKAKG